MRRFTPAIFAIAATILATAGCDSEQPATSPSTTASLSITARADVDNNNCYDVWYDLDGDGTPEFDSQQKFCEVVSPPAQLTDNRPVPWHYSAQVSILRAGTTVPQIVASSVIPGDTIPDYVSLTAYDPLVRPAPVKNPEGNAFYLNGVEVSRGSPIWLQANGYDLGPQNVLESSPTLEFDLALGDTVIVEARKQARFDGPPYLQTPVEGEEPPDVNLTLTGVLLVGGGEVLVNGTTASSTADKAGFSFSYTRR